MTEDAKTVTDWLREVSYGQNASYIPSDFALEFVTFIKLINGEEGEENKTPLIHYKILDTLDTGSSNVANMIFRGAAKTTLCGEYFFLYLAVYGRLPNFGKVNLAIYVSDSIDNGVKSMRKNLEYRWENSEFLRRYVPEIKFTDIRWEFTNADGNKFVVKAYGAKTGLRGTKEMGKRPQIAVLDDLVSDDDARSPTVLEAIKATVYKAVDYALHPTRNKKIWLGTPFNANDPLYEAVESGAWAVNVFPVCEKFPCTKAEFRGAWEDRFTYDYVNQKYNDARLAGKVDTFYQELMLQILSDDTRLIQPEDLQWYSHAALMKNRGNFNFYITTDFATSTRQSSDLSVISVWAVNNKGFKYWVDGIAEQQTMDKNLDDLFRLCQKYNPMEVGIEVSGQQGGFIPWIQEKMLEKNIYFSLASDNNNNKPGIRPSVDKLQRFNVMVPEFKTKRMYFPDNMTSNKALKELLHELELATVTGFKSKYDDAIDTVSMLALMNIWLPSAEQVGHINAKGIWEDGPEEQEQTGLSSYLV
mgnify:CR=1 FL=1